MFDLAGLWAISNDALLQKALKLYENALAGAGYLPAPPKAVEDLVRRVKADADAGTLAATGLSGPGRSGVVAVIPVWGMITQHPTWLEAYGLACSAAGVEAAIRTALAAPEVSAIVLRINSPGGQMQGLPQLCEFIRGVRGDKPILGHADSNATSAAYMLLASCTEAWASPLAVVGSLGCFMVHTSTKGADEQYGIKRTMVRMPEGKAVATWDGEDLSEEGQKELMALVTAGYAAAVTIVAKGRKVGAAIVQGERFGQGAILDAGAAVEGGMVDGVRSFQDTLVAASRWRPAKATGPRGEAQLEVAADVAKPPEPEPIVESQPAQTPEEAAATLAAADVELERFRQQFT